MKVNKTAIDDVIVFEHKYYPDERGWFTELYKQDLYTDYMVEIFQISQSFSKKGTIRGFHYQACVPVAKCMRVVTGHAILATLDLRKQSSTFGTVIFENSIAGDGKVVFAPGSCARGFLALEDTQIEYWQNGYYNHDDNRNISPFSDKTSMAPWNTYMDPSLFILSDNDRNAPTFEVVNLGGYFNAWC